MTLNTNRFPPSACLTTWENVYKFGVVFPDPKATKQELWDWINDHGKLINDIRDQAMVQVKNYIPPPPKRW